MSHKLNIEKIKNDKSSNDIIADIFYYCVTGEMVSIEDLERFKWHGIYVENEDQTSFSLKIPLPLGELNLLQLKTILELLKRFNLNEVNFNEGQKLEFRNIKLSTLPNIFNILQESSLSSFFESGHSIKNVLTCPVNGLDSTQLFDVEDLANKLNSTFVGNKNFFNLPNSLQFAISGYPEGCDAGIIPDVSFNARKNLKDKIVFEIKVGSTSIGNIAYSQVIPTARAIANIYKDYGQREDYSSTDFKSFIDDLELINFSHILSSMLDVKIFDSSLINSNIEPKKPRMGIHKSAKDGFSYIGLNSKYKSFTQNKLEEFIKSLEENQASRIKITHKSNIIILDAPSKNSENLHSNLLEIEL